MLRTILLPLFILMGTLVTAQSYTESGFAVYYADYFEGRATANGEIFSNSLYTCAHASHPFGTILKVTRKDVGKSVTVRVNDRGGFGSDVVVDLTKAAASDLGFISAGKAFVEVEIVGFSASPTGPAATPAPTPAPSTAKGNTPIKYLPSGQKGFFIQLASYTIKSNAERQYEAWTNKGISYLYLYQEGPKYSIVMGPFTSRVTAEDRLKGLKENHYMDGFIREFR